MAPCRPCLALGNTLSKVKLYFTENLKGQRVKDYLHKKGLTTRQKSHFICKRGEEIKRTVQILT